MMPSLSRISVRNRSRGSPATRPSSPLVSPGVTAGTPPPWRCSLDRPARVRMLEAATACGVDGRVDGEDGSPRAMKRSAWRPWPETPVGSYVMRLTVETAEGRRKVCGGSPSRPELARRAGLRCSAAGRARPPVSYRPGKTHDYDRGGREALRSSCSRGADPDGARTAPTRCAAYRWGIRSRAGGSSRFARPRVPFPVGELASGLYAPIDTRRARRLCTAGRRPTTLRPLPWRSCPRSEPGRPTTTRPRRRRLGQTPGTRAAARRSASIGRSETGYPALSAA